MSRWKFSLGPLKGGLLQGDPLRRKLKDTHFDFRPMCSHVRGFLCMEKWIASILVSGGGGGTINIQKTC